MVAGDVDGDAFVKAVERALNCLEAVPYASARLDGGAAADRPGAGKVMVDLPAHDRRLATDGVCEVGRVGGRGVGDDGEGGLQRMGEIAGMAARFFSLLFTVGEKLVDLLRQRSDFGRE